MMFFNLVKIGEGAYFLGRLLTLNDYIWLIFWQRGKGFGTLRIRLALYNGVSKAVALSNPISGQTSLKVLCRSLEFFFKPLFFGIFNLFFPKGYYFWGTNLIGRPFLNPFSHGIFGAHRGPSGEPIWGPPPNFCLWFARQGFFGKKGAFKAFSPQKNIFLGKTPPARKEIFLREEFPFHPRGVKEGGE